MDIISQHHPQVPGEANNASAPTSTGNYQNKWNWTMLTPDSMASITLMPNTIAWPVMDNNLNSSRRSPPTATANTSGQNFSQANDVHAFRTPTTAESMRVADNAADPEGVKSAQITDDCNVIRTTEMQTRSWRPKLVQPSPDTPAMSAPAMPEVIALEVFNKQDAMPFGRSRHSAAPTAHFAA
jgi:hypothetical protein